MSDSVQSVSSNDNDKVPQNRQLLKQWLNRCMKVKITDGRTLIGTFLCTDKNSNLVLGSCMEFTVQDVAQKDKALEPRTIGLSMIPGHHIVSISIDEPLVAS